MMTMDLKKSTLGRHSTTARDVARPSIGVRARETTDDVEDDAIDDVGDDDGARWRRARDREGPRRVTRLSLLDFVID